MNPWQLAQQLKHVLGNVTWPTGAVEKVFGSAVYVYAGSQPNEEEIPPGFPFALVTIDSGIPDQDAPDLLLQTFSIVTAVEVAGDPLGEFAIIGGARVNEGTSAGAGVAEVAERVRAAVQQLTGADGASMIVSGTGTGAPTALGRGRHLAFDEFRVTALCTSQPHYAPPQEFKIVGEAFSWRGERQCEARFDFMQYRVGYVAGHVPARTPAECISIVYTGTDHEVAIVPIPGRTWSVFADYDPRDTGAVAFSSDGAAVGAFVRT